MGLISKIKKTKKPAKDAEEGEEVQDISAFLQLVEETGKLISDVRTDVDKLKRLHDQILSSPTSSADTKAELEQLTDTIWKSGFIHVKTKLKNIEKFVASESNDDDTPTVTVRIAKNQHAALVRNFKELMEEYQTAQVDYRDKCKGRIERQLKILGEDLSEEQLNKVLEDENFNVFTQGILQETEEARRTLTEVNIRHAEILKVEKSVREVNQLMIEIADLVESQGQTIQKIVVKVEETANNTVDGAEQLRSAKKKKKLARKCKIYCATVGVIAVVVIVVIIVCL